VLAAATHHAGHQAAGALAARRQSRVGRFRRISRDGGARRVEHPPRGSRWTPHSSWQNGEEPLANDEPRVAEWPL